MKLKKVSDILKSPKFDPSGSYTGVVTDDEYGVPEQDVDDL